MSPGDPVVVLRWYPVGGGWLWVDDGLENYMLGWLEMGCSVGFGVTF